MNCRACNSNRCDDCSHERVFHEGNVGDRPKGYCIVIDCKCDEFEPSWHYKRTCLYCGAIWGGLHCPHDVYQNACPVCNKKPVVVKRRCTCHFNY